MDIRKSEFRVAGATQDATSTERCDLTQDPSTMNYIYIYIYIEVYMYSL